MKNISSFYIAIFLLISIVTFNCDNEDAVSTNAACDQECQDNNTAYGLVHIYNFIWNQHFAGQPTGTHDITVSGPKGGSVHITGTTEYSNNGINTVHLVFEMTNCKGLDENYSLTFNGTVNAEGTFSSTYSAMGFSATQLMYSGTVGKNANVSVNATCDFVINQTTNNLSGLICGREFAY
jgi:hypothetical protein